MAANSLVTTFSVQGATSVQRALNNQMTSVSKRLRDMNGLWAAAGVAVTGLTVAVAAFTEGLRRGWEEGAKELTEYERNLALLKNTMEDVSELTSKINFENQTREMEKFFKNSLAAKSEILRIQAAIGRTTQNQEVLTRATEATLELMAGRQDMSAGAAAQWMTTLLGDPGRTVDKMRRAEIQVTKTQQATLEWLVSVGRMTEAQLMVIDIITARYAGSTNAVLSTTSGKIERFNQLFVERFRQGVGAARVQMGSFWTDMGQLLTDHEELWTESFEMMGKAVKELGDIISATVKIFSGIVQTLDETRGLAKDILGLIEETPQGRGTGREEEEVRFRDLANKMVPGTGTVTAGAMDFLNPKKYLDWYKTLGQTIEEVTGAHLRNQPSLATTGKDLSRAEIARLQREKERADQEAALEKLRLEKMEEQAALFEKAQKKFLVLSQDQETPMERYGRQFRIYQEYMVESAKSAGHAARATEALTVLRKLEAKAMYDAAAPMRAIEEFQRKENERLEQFVMSWVNRNPITKLTKDFNLLRTAADKTDPTLMVAAYEEFMESIKGQFEKETPDQGFRSVSTGIEGLYSAIQQAAISQDPVVEAVERQTAEEKAALRRLQRGVTLELRRIRALGGVGP